MPTVNRTKTESEFKRTKYVIFIFAFLILLFIYKTLPKKQEINQTIDSNSAFTQQVANSDLPISEEDLKEEEGKYIDKDLRFSFRYPEGSNLQTCGEGSKCIYIPDHSIRVEFLKSSYYDHSSIKDALLEIDLFCSYETEQLSTSCTNIKMEEYTNSEGILSYVLYRSKYVRETNPNDGSLKNGTYHEKAYIFPIKDDVYGIAIFSADSPLKENQAILNSIVDTFKLI